MRAREARAGVSGGSGGRVVAGLADQLQDAHPHRRIRQKVRAALLYRRTRVDLLIPTICRLPPRRIRDASKAVQRAAQRCTVWEERGDAAVLSECAARVCQSDLSCIDRPRFTSKVVEAAAFYYESLFAFGQVIRSRASGRESNAANFKPSSLFRRTVTPSRLGNDFLLTTASGSTASRASAITYRSHRRSTGFSSTGDDWNEAAHAFQLQRSNFCQHQTFIITQFKWAAGAGRLASGSTQGCHCQTSGQTAQRERVPK
mmetsp:Transcript_15908/g.39875  ORF Transcript_15908/g.39875 Transcript_15908/m.39875 type:complete len:259 (+) Transcript_15908:1370-2146(+)